jgi:SAM-dependent methyltransferase
MPYTAIQTKLFTRQDIERINNTYVVNRPHTYYTKAHERWEASSPEFKTKFANWDFTRPAAIFDFEDWIEKYNLKNIDKLLVTDDQDHEVTYLTANHKTIINFEPEYNVTISENDLHVINLEEKNHDFAIVNQTFEHLYNPFVAIKNIYDHLKPGGFFYTSVPIINIPHLLPHHFWGITPIGLCMLGESVGFEVKECGFWGSKKYTDYIMTHNWWPNADQVRNEHGIIENTYHQQVNTWILLQK